MGKVIGIDLGTGNSCVAIIDEDNKTRVLLDENGKNTVPSIFAINSKQEPLVGRAARDQADTNRLNTIFAVKRLIGRKFDSAEVQEAAEKLPYKIIQADNGDAWVEVNEEPKSPEEVSSEILTYLKKMAENELGEEVTHCVITVPAHFNDSQRQATRDAGKLANMTVLNIINEPTAAALAYGMDHVEKESDEENDKERIIVVFDLGAGTFDITILGLNAGLFDVKSTGGDTFLGGEDFDLAIVNHLISVFKNDHGIDLTKDKMALQRIKAAGLKAKHDLSDQVKTQIEIPFVASGGGSPKDIKLEFQRKEMERVVGHLLIRLEGPCVKALDDAGYTPEDVDEVILVGGMTRMPLIRKQCQKIFGKKPIDTVNPDESVACGAAVQAGLMQGILDGMELSDVLPLSLAIESAGGRVVQLLERNTKVPAESTLIFTTSSPNQTDLEIHLLQGESGFAVENKSLGKVMLENIPAAARGHAQIAVTLEVDNSGIMDVAAKNLDTGEEQKIQIMASSGLSEAELNQLMRESRQHRLEEERRGNRAEERSTETQASQEEEGRRDESPELIEAKGALRSAIFAAQFLFDTQGKYIKKAKKAELSVELDKAREALDKGTEIPAIKEVTVKISEIGEYLEELLEAA